MRFGYAAAVTLLTLACSHAQPRPDGGTEIEGLLREFLSKVDRPEMHARFWADDVIYVSATGNVRSKAEILKNVTEGAAKAPSEPGPAFDAENVRVRQFGDVAVLNFRLVARAEGKATHYRNSGVFVERDGRWQAVSWQATKEPEGEGQ
ncbi:MAG: nuclear transport factor 2 family protein [Myxococcales bacterium]|nr:nuclear transport factor 2 family protein [Myxococcales bacterium]